MSEAQVIINDDGFKIAHENEIYNVQDYFVDPLLKNLKKHNKFEAFLEKGCKIHIIKMDDGEFKLTSKIPGFGGGIIGAAIGAFVGKAGVSIVGHGTIALIGFAVGTVNPVAGYATTTALESWCGATIEAVSIKAAIGCGIAFGAATGPV